MGDRTPMTPRVIAVMGGARGVGRSSIALNLAVAVAQRAHRVCLLDAAGGPLLGGVTRPQNATLLDVAAGRARLSDALCPGPDGIAVLPLGTTDRRTSAPVSDWALLAHVDALETRFDLVLVNTPGGAHALFFARAATEVLLVVTPEAQVLRQAEALVRTLAQRCGRHELLALPNACQAPVDATAVVRTLTGLASRPPHVRVRALGWIPYDEAVTESRRTRRTLVAGAPEAPVTQAIARVADRLVSLAPARATGGAQFFFQSLIAQGRAA